MSRVDDELALLRHRFDTLEYRVDGQWVRIPNYTIPNELWQPSLIQVAFQIPPDAATAPYAFHARPEHNDHHTHLRAISDQPIGSYTYPTETPWGADWGTFSWQLETWEPKVPINEGTTMLDFARSIAGRFSEGP